MLWCYLVSEKREVIGQWEGWNEWFFIYFVEASTKRSDLTNLDPNPITQPKLKENTKLNLRRTKIKSGQPVPILLNKSS